MHFVLRIRFFLRMILFFFFNDTATTEIYTLSLHDALPIRIQGNRRSNVVIGITTRLSCDSRSEEHTSELQSRENLVCRLLLEKKKTKLQPPPPPPITLITPLFSMVSSNSNIHSPLYLLWLYLFFFNYTSNPDTYTLSLHDALPI